MCRCSLNPETDITPDEEAWTAVGSYPDEETAHEHALVVLAMGAPCRIDLEPRQHRLRLEVPGELSPRALEEIEAYEQESGEPLPPEETDGPLVHSPGIGVYILWALSLAVIHELQSRHPWLAERGASSSTELIAQGEWWRPLTALFLHADYEHLLGNLLSGLFFSTLVASSIGAWRGWALILLCGALGNLATSLAVWPEAYRSIGASSAVFGALGILSGLGLAWMLRLRGKVPWLRVIAPVIAGIVVLGMTGSGLPEDNTDVLGHVFGFTAGVMAGSLAGWLSCRANSGTSRAGSGAPT